MKKTRAVILAGGEGSRLGVLTAKRAKPAVPFAGKYRIIDFTLSNCVNSGIFDVMMITQYRPHSLNDHIGAGRPWDLDRGFTGGVKIYQPFRGRSDTDWYRGTADAIYQNWSFVESSEPENILVLSGDHIYRMNYGPMLDFHLERKADLTIATLNVTIEEATRMGILAIDEDKRVVEFVEKPKDPPGTLASMGVYIFSRRVLDRVLKDDKKKRDSSHDFGKDIVPRMVQDGARVFAYPFADYWVDVGTIEAYWHTHMDLLATPPPLDLNDRSWVIHTQSEERPPVKIESGAQISDSMITDGCVISKGAIVERSVLSPGVIVGPGAVIRESVILTDAVLESGARVERAIIDKLVHIGKRARVGEMSRGEEAPGIATVGKHAQIPSGMRIPRGVVIDADATPEFFLLDVSPSARGQEKKA